MKPESQRRIYLSSLVLGLALGVFACGSLAQVSNFVNGFDVGTSVASWTTLWAGGSLAKVDLSWDASHDAGSNAASGSLRAVANFHGEDQDQFMFFGTFANREPWDFGVVLDANRYIDVGFDIRVDPATAPGTNGTFGRLEVALVTSNYSVISIGSVDLPLSATNWTHVVQYINTVQPGIDKTVGLGFKLWSAGLFTNTWVINVDNLGLYTLCCPTPPPTLTLEKAIPGLQLVATTTGGGSQHQNIHTVAPDYSWINAAGAVTYSLVIAQHPNGEVNPGFETHLLLIPQADLPAGPADLNADTAATNVLSLVIKNGPGGSAVARVKWKGPELTWLDTNALVAPFAVGNWSLILANNIHATLLAPNGATANLSLPDGLVPAFNGPVYAYIGIQPKAGYNIGAMVVIREIQITGSATELNDRFGDPTIDSTRWGMAAADNAGILVAPATAGYWLSWSNPAFGYTLQASTVLQPGAWHDIALATNAMDCGAVNRLLLPASALPSSGGGFFRLSKP